MSPVIFRLTASAPFEDRSRCIRGGMNDHLTKLRPVAALALVLERWRDQPGLVAAVPAGLLANSTMADTPAAEPVLMDFERIAQFRKFNDDDLSMTRAVMDLFRTDAAQRLEVVAQAIRAEEAQALLWGLPHAGHSCCGHPAENPGRAGQGTGPSKPGAGKAANPLEQNSHRAGRVALTRQALTFQAPAAATGSSPCSCASAGSSSSVFNCAYSGVKSGAVRSNNCWKLSITK